MHHTQINQSEPKEKLQVKSLHKVKTDHSKTVSDALNNPSKWKQFKIQGKNLPVRSYSSACIVKNHLYIYGGQQVLNNLLSDFYKLNIQTNKFTHFQWTPIQCKEIGPRARHSAVVYKQKIYMFGGLISAFKNTNRLDVFDTCENIWTQIQAKENYPSPLDSHSSVILNQKMYIIGGYIGQNQQKYTNQIWQYDIQQNQWEKIFKQGYGPEPRSDSPACANDRSIFIFGGINSNIRFNDLWEFSLADKTWKQIKYKGDIIPLTRNGHSLNIYNKKLIIFGGIHEITWQLNDMYCFDLQQQIWEQLEHQTLKKKSKQLQFKQLKNKNQKFPNLKKKQSKKYFYNQQKNSDTRKSKSYQQFKTQSFTLDQHKNNKSKIINQQKKKQIQQKKNEMLQMFQIDQKQYQKYIKQLSITQQIRDTLEIIGYLQYQKNKSKTKKQWQLSKSINPHFKQPLKNIKNIQECNKPCPRDGHNSCLIQKEKKLIIFGGDRHQMSFADIFTFDLSYIK